MTTFSNDDKAGYTYKDAAKVAKDILAGEYRFLVRVVTWDNEHLEASYSMFGAQKNINKIFSECGIPLTKEKASKQKEYTFTQFKNDFSKLPKAEQKKLLRELKAKLHK